MRQRNDWVQLVTEFENSGLTQVEFAKRRGIKLTTFRQGYSVARKRLGRDSTQQPVRFVPVKVGDVDRGRPGRLFEACMGQLSLRFEVGTDVTYVVSLLGQLSRAC
jgi:hypothetical protein